MKPNNKETATFSLQFFKPYEIMFPIGNFLLIIEKTMVMLPTCQWHRPSDAIGCGNDDWSL